MSESGQRVRAKPIGRVESSPTSNQVASWRASWMSTAMAVGAEKVKDSGYAGLNAFPIPNDGTARTLTAAAMFSMVAPAFRIVRARSSEPA